jgi:tRNA-2-methylthio-N6-dimethylallyladenosine synthase
LQAAARSPEPLSPEPLMLYHIHTFGCQMNYSDTERIETYLNNLGFKKAKTEKQADLIIFNSCSVRQKAEDRVLGKMQQLILEKRKRKNLLLALTGCMVRKSSTKKTYIKNQDYFIKTIAPLDIAFRIEDLPKLKSLIEEVSKKSKIKPLPKTDFESLSNYFHIPAKYKSNFQAFIPISTGCDKFCTYCIVPYSRGREVSRPMGEILNEAEELVKNGCLEITLLGQTVDSYGLSNIDRQKHLFNYDEIDAGTTDPPFVQLLKKLDKLYSKGLRRLRFTSPHPKDISPQLVECYKTLKTLMPHIHLPIQSGDNNCLKRMNRPYTRERYLEIIKALRKANPAIAITTDIIVGFCGETEKEFQNTLDLYKKVEFDFAYFAQYSTRKNTYASKHLKDDVPTKEKRRRWHELNNILKKITQKKLEKYIGKTVEVLVEKHSGNTYTGTSHHNKVVQFKSPKKSLKGTLQKTKITKAENWVLLGNLQ